MLTPRPTRREQQRAQTLAEIKQLAMAQVAAGGVESLSLNAIAKDMAMSGAAIYRYFDGREQLLAALAVDAYTDLAEIEVAVEVVELERAAPEADANIRTQVVPWTEVAPHVRRECIGV